MKGLGVAVALVVGAVAAGPLLSGPYLPPAGFYQYGCTIDEAQEQDHSSPGKKIELRHRLEIWAKYPAGRYAQGNDRWGMVEGYYGKRTRAMKACDRWMEAVKKARLGGEM